MSRHPMSSESTLRTILWSDAAICSVTGVLLLAGARPLARWMGFPHELLRGAGLIMIPYVVFLILLAQRRSIPDRGVLIAILVNVAWAIGCLVILLHPRLAPNAFGIIFVLVNAAAVLLMAQFQARARHAHYPVPA